MKFNEFLDLYKKELNCIKNTKQKQQIYSDKIMESLKQTKNSIKVYNIPTIREIV